MFKKLKTLMIALVTASTVFIPILAPATASAAIEDDLKKGSCLSTQDPDCVTDEEATTRINNALKLVINIFSLVVGVISVIMIIIGGLKYITSGGDSGNVTSAKNTILYAVIGLVIVALAQFIVRFVLARVSNT